MKKYLWLGVLFVTSFLFLFAVPSALGAINDCKPGYKFNARSGVGCQQENCYDIPDAHYSYTGHCICGSSGSINENDADPNKECYLDNSDSSCPSCLYACVHLDDKCPHEEEEEVEEELETIPTPELYDAEDETEDVDEEENEEETNNETFSDEEVDNWWNDLWDALFSRDDNKTEDNLAGNNLSNIRQDIDRVNSSQTRNPDPLNSAGYTIPTSEGDSDDGAEEEEEEEAEEGAANPVETCESTCQKMYRSKKGATITGFLGTPPNCKCYVDYKNDQGQLVMSEQREGDKITEWTFNPSTGALINKNNRDLAEEREAIRQSLGYKYDEEKIDKMLESGEISKWFQNQMKDVKTETRMWHAQFWWQHAIAMLDHGASGNDPNFVDNNEYGRCGDSMLWLERNLGNKLGLEDGKKTEAMLSITGEKVWGQVTHTALIIRPNGVTNTDWKELVDTLSKKSGGDGLTESDIKGLSPELMNAKVLDPYFKEETTVKEFIKGWTTIRIS